MFKTFDFFFSFHILIKTFFFFAIIKINSDANLRTSTESYLRVPETGLLPSTNEYVIKIRFIYIFENIMKFKIKFDQNTFHVTRKNIKKKKKKVQYLKYTKILSFEVRNFF